MKTIKVEITHRDPDILERWFYIDMTEKSAAGLRHKC